MVHLRQCFHQTRQASGKDIEVFGRHDDQMQPLGVLAQHLQRQMGLTLLLPFAVHRLHLARRQQGGKPRIGGAVLRVGEDFRATEQHQTRADQGANMGLFGLHMQPHHARQRVVIRDAEAVVAVVIGHLDQVHGVGGRAQEGKATGQPKLHVLRPRRGGKTVFAQRSAFMSFLLGHQAKSPCKNQRGSAPRPS